MSAAAPTASGAPIKAGSGKKKLIIIMAVVLLLVVAGGGAAVWFLKSKAAHAKAEADDETASAAEPASKVDLKHPPTFLPLDPFVVNLADRDADRYAQIGITLELDSPEFGEQMKAYMPAVRNAILLILARKTAADLLGADGKEALAAEIMREAVRPMGIEIDPPAKKGQVEDKPAAKADAKADADSEDEDAKPKKKKKKAEVHNPVRAVNFSNFIIQ